MGCSCVPFHRLDILHLPVGGDRLCATYVRHQSHLVKSKGKAELSEEYLLVQAWTKHTFSVLPTPLSFVAFAQ